MKYRAVAGLVMCLLLVAAGTHAAYGVGDTVSNFTLNDSSGNPVTLYNFVGKVVWLNFFTTT